MFFRSVFLKTLRDYRVAILGWGIGMGLVIVSPMASVAALISTPQQRAALATLAAQFAWNADPVAADRSRTGSVKPFGRPFSVASWESEAFVLAMQTGSVSCPRFRIRSSAV